MGDIPDELRLHLRRHHRLFIGNSQLFISLLVSDGGTPAIEEQQQECQDDGRHSQEDIPDLRLLLFCLEFINLEEGVL